VDDVTTLHLREAILHGYFPMDMDGEIGWYSTRRRALFPIEGIRVSRSLARTLERGDFEVRFDSAFEAVMRGCLRPQENWISEPLIGLYAEAFREGWAHCVEVWRGEELVGGSYGLAYGTTFGAESMFHRATDMSKVALWALIGRCRDLGFERFDAQIMNPHLASLGAFEVPNSRYLRWLHDGLRRTTPWSEAFWTPEFPNPFGSPPA
jgi:leucyl/phenylalanyl-tRNA--protein transferase